MPKNHPQNSLHYCAIEWAVLVILLLPCLSLSAASAQASKKYRIGSGDLIKIKVYEEKDLSLQFRVDDTGQISYPFLGELQITGLTLAALEKRITTGLKGPYLIDPKVTVSVLEYRLFYVNGEVKKSGGYPFQPSLTVRKAVSLAGGLTERASRKKIFIIREDDPQKKSRRARFDDRVYPGDIITVEQSFF